MVLILKYAFAALALVGGVLLFILGDGEAAIATAASLIFAATGIVAGTAGTIPKDVHRAAVKRATGEVAVAKKVGP